MLFIINSKGGAVCRGLGVLDAIGDVVDRHPEAVLEEAPEEVTSNIGALF